MERAPTSGAGLRIVLRLTLSGVLASEKEGKQEKSERIQVVYQPPGNRTRSGRSAEVTQPFDISRS